MRVTCTKQKTNCDGTPSLEGCALEVSKHPHPSLPFFSCFRSLFETTNPAVTPHSAHVGETSGSDRRELVHSGVGAQLAAYAARPKPAIQMISSLNAVEPSPTPDLVEDFRTPIYMRNYRTNPWYQLYSCCYNNADPGMAGHKDRSASAGHPKPEKTSQGAKSRVDARGNVVGRCDSGTRNGREG